MATGLSLFGVVSTPGWSPWWTVAVAVLTIVAAILTWPAGDGHAVVSGSTFVKGDAVGSSFNNVVTHSTETFLAGSAIGSVFRNIQFNVVSRRWPSAVALAILGALALGELLIIVMTKG